MHTRCSNGGPVLCPGRGCTRSGLLARRLDWSKGNPVELEVVDIETAAADAAWRHLYEEQESPANPFCAPNWIVTWYRHFVPEPGQRRLCFIRSNAGDLLGVAPLWFDYDRVGPVRIATRLRLVGAGQGSALLEMPQVLAKPGQARPILSLIVKELATPGSVLAGADLMELIIADGQGWLEPEWPAIGNWAAASWNHVDAQAAVIIPIGPTWTETLAGLKRNVKESLRRSRNRLSKRDRPWDVVRRGIDLDTAAVDRFLDLHGMRSQREGRAQHHDAFAQPERRRFIRELLPRLGADGDAAIWELWLGGREVAAQLVLHAPGTLYVHSSGFDPSTWELGPVTHLQEHAFRAACEDGLRWVNLSPGPNLAKLRWSERLLRHDEFWISFGSGRTLLRQSALAVGRALRVVKHNARLAERAR